MTDTKKTVMAIYGSFVEWYDFALIAAMSKYINANFFNANEPISRLINIFLIFAVGYLARPLGALFFGYYGDQYGRQRALLLSLLLISLATLSIGCLPTIHSVALLATMCLVIFRFVQGFGSGGEHAGGILLLYENENKNSFRNTNFAILAIMGGLFFGFASAYLMSLVFDDETMNAWAWRIPFVLGGLFGLAGVILRMEKRLKAPIEVKMTGLNHYRHFFSENKKSILIASGIYTHSVALFYTNYFFYPGYMEAHSLIESDIINQIRIIMAVFFLALFFLFCHYLTQKNCTLWLKIASGSTAIFIFPLHYLMVNFGIYGYVISMAVLTIVNVMYLLPIAGLLSELFAHKYRYTGVSLSINIVSSLFGGTAPLLLSLLVGYFNSFFVGGLYLFATALISYFTISLPEKKVKKGMAYVS